MPQPPRLLALTDSLSPWHSFWIRFGQFLPHLPFSWRVSTSVVAARIADGSLSLAHHLSETGVWWHNPELVFLYRFAADPALLPVLQAARQAGSLLVADIDDDLWSASAQLPKGREKWTRERLQLFTATLRLVHVITCSTPALLELLSQMFPAVRVMLMPNCAPAAVVQPPRRDGLFRLGWTGAPWCRPFDLALLRPLASWALQQPQIRFVHLGHLPGRLSFAEALDLPPNRVETVPLRSYEHYLQSFAFDVGLAPLQNTLFNHFKSDLKLLEYSSFGLPWVASAVEPYHALAQQWGQQQLLCEHPEQFIPVVESLMDPACRAAVGEALLNRADERSFSRSVEAWRQLLSQEFGLNR